MGGGGEEKEKLCHQCHILGLDGYVKFKGTTDNINSELLRSSIYVMTSRYEGLPMVLIEAQSCGLPIVSFDCPEGPSEIIHDRVDGNLIPMGNIQEMVSSIISLANDYEKRKSMVGQAKKSSRRYYKDTVRSLWVKMISKLMNN